MQPFKKWLTRCSILVFGLALWLVFSYPQTPPIEKGSATKQAIAQSLSSSVSRNFFPEKGELDVGDKRAFGQFKYTLDALLQNRMENLFQSYKPDYGAFVALDPQTGAILALQSYTREKTDLGNLCLRATFPAASVFKIVTAAAAIDQEKAGTETVISFTGANHTLYKRNVEPPKTNRWLRHMSIREAFARSVNTVFGKIGAYTLKRNDLTEYANRFQFNQLIPADLPVEMGRFAFKGDDAFHVAEVASGYNREVLMSPLQGAMIAAAIANDGLMMEPYLVESFQSDKGTMTYYGEPKPLGYVVSKKAADALQLMMQDTVRVGTSRKSFRDLVRSTTGLELEMGGETGSLTGTDPRGKYDWFVGYARYGERRLALAALTINEDNWRVKSSYLAKKGIENFFGPEVKRKRSPKSHP